MWNHTFTIPCVACDRPFRPLQYEALEAAKMAGKCVFLLPRPVAGFNLSRRSRWVVCSSVFVLNIHLHFFA